MEKWLLIPFSFGLLSSLHCLGMCGGIMGALTLSLPPEIKTSPLRLGSYLLAYNVGRIGSYAVAGILAALFGQQMIALLSPQVGHFVLQGLASLALIITAIYLGGWFSFLGKIEAMGALIWQFLAPIHRRLIPSRNLAQAFIFGLVWGWFPCALVYSALVWSVAAPTPLTGAVSMVAFGLGTLPLVMTMGAMWQGINQLRQRQQWQQWVAILFLIAAIGNIGGSFIHFGHDMSSPDAQPSTQPHHHH